jgi:hypothetical protein
VAHYVDGFGYFYDLPPTFDPAAIHGLTARAHQAAQESLEKRVAEEKHPKGIDITDVRTYERSSLVSSDSNLDAAAAAAADDDDDDDDGAIFKMDDVPKKRKPVVSDPIPIPAAPKLPPTADAPIPEVNLDANKTAGIDDENDLQFEFSPDTASAMRPMPDPAKEVPVKKVPSIPLPATGLDDGTIFGFMKQIHQPRETVSS